MPRLSRTYCPQRSWRLAGLYLLLLAILSTAAGTPQELIRSPLVTALQWRNPLWWFLLTGSWLITYAAYGIYWPRHTLLFNRSSRPWTQAGFGISWGLILGLWMITLMRWAKVWLPGEGAKALPGFILGFGMISLWQALTQSYFWGVYVAPEHDTPVSNKRKVWVCHAPHLLGSLTFLFMFGNGALFTVLQMYALALTSLAMRMPAWWEKSPQKASTTRPGMLGLPRTHGWQGEAQDGGRQGRTRR